MGSSFWRKSAAALLAFSLSQPGMVLYAQASPQNHGGDRDGHGERADLIRLLRQRVKYVFVFYQENRSFDSYFGTFPGADGLFTRDADHTSGFNQTIINTDGSMGMIHPFRIGPKDMCPLATVNGVVTPTACYAADTDDIDHSHPRTVAKMDVQSGTALMDMFAVTEERKYSPMGNPSTKAKQFGELAMAYEDCDTIPILWQYASKFVLFDHIFETVTGPSTPGNLSIIGAQSGETQWVRHPDQAFTDNGSSKPGVPVPNDLNPLWGSLNDPNMPPLVPANPGDSKGVKPGQEVTQINLTFATLPLTLPGGSLPGLTATDNDPDGDLGDVKEDVQFIAGLNKDSVPFGWYEEGYDKEPTDPGPVDANGTHASYITHHNGPQYFGYVANNPQMVKQLHGLQDFFDAVDKETLPREGGVFYVKGGFQNLFGLLPTDMDSKAQTHFLGDDDHPGYSDAQISEAMVAEAINKIASSKYWKESAIIITWDDSEGDFDHVPPPIRTAGPDGSIITNGPRVPLMLISPYARTGYVAHDQGSHSSVVKFIDTVFNLPPLALLPDEFFYRFVAEEKGMDNLGPEDAITPGISDLLSAFDRDRLEDDNPLPPSYVKIPEKLIKNLPDATGFGCKDLGIVTTDRALGIKNQVPADFNPRPSTNPTP
jgi:phospholipase C